MKPKIIGITDIDVRLEVDTEKSAKPTGEATERLRAKGTLDTADLATYFKVTNGTIDRWRKNGLLPYINLGRKYYIWEDVEALIISKRRRN
jgi:DNA-binding transcriptional regulator YiaG